MGKGFFSLLLTISVLLAIIVSPMQADAAAVIGLPRTGQTKCYDTSGAVIPCAGTGQDGDIQAGIAWPEPRFTTGIGAEAACVTDSLTGLMWTRDANLPRGKLWNDAIDYVNGLILCGHDDWRLPNMIELDSLLNFAEANPAAWLNTQGFTNVGTDNGEYYWTSTTRAYLAGGGLHEDDAWHIWMNLGLTDHFEKATTVARVWAVRDIGAAPARLWKTGQTTSYRSGDDGDLETGIAWPTPRFSVIDDCVVDNLTGLIWTRDANLAGKKPRETSPLGEGALEYVKSLTLCGHSDWRLPNRKELMSLVDWSHYEPGLPAGHPFVNWAGPGDGLYWTSTTYMPEPNYAWVMTMFEGYMSRADKKWATYYVWPVRGGCLGHPAKVEETTYQSIQDAYAAANDGDTILIQALDITEDLYMTNDISVGLHGGYECDFISTTGFTSVHGILMINKGTVTIENLLIQ